MSDLTLTPEQLAGLPDQATALSEEPGAGPTYEGSALGLARIAFVNAMLSIFTLGFYRFWGKTRIRRYLWGHLRWQGDDFEYSGRGIELFIGFLVAMAILFPLVVVFSLMQGFLAAGGLGFAFAQLVFYLVLFFLIEMAIFRARRYRLSRTQWRGIRAGQSGSAVRYALIAMGWILLTGLTLGLLYPVMRTRLQRYRTENTWFGDIDFEFDGRAGELFGTWLLALLLYIPTLGISHVWYRVKEFRYFASRTRWGGLSFASTLETPAVVLIMILFGIAFYGLFAVVGYVIFDAIAVYIPTDGAGEAEQMAMMAEVPWQVLALVAVTVMLATTLAQVLRMVLLIHPLLKAVCRTLVIEGSEDFERLAQSEIETPGRGEGLADALDVGAI
jgi:uncharacterized membrane protein YjgN (DUF898 family)